MHYIKEVLQKNKFTMLAHIATGILLAFVTNYKADYFQDVIDGLTAGTLALGNILVYGLILFAGTLLGYLEEYPWKKVENDIYLDFKLMALGKMSAIDYTEYQRLGTGKLVQRIESGAEAGRNVIVHFWLRLIRELLPTILFSVYFIWKISPAITYVLLAGYGIVFLVTNILLKFLYQIKEKILNNEEKLNHYLVRGFMEMLTFRMQRQFAGEIRKATKAKRDIVSTKVKMNMIHEAFFTIFALLVGMIEIAIVVYAWKSQELSVGSVVALIALIGNAYTPIAIFNVLYVQYKLDKAAYGRLEGFLAAQDDPQLQEGKALEALHGNISVQDLCFQYDDRVIFDKLSLCVKSGEKVAFVGESGCGKSTLVKLLVGLLKYDSGDIYFDDTQLKDICLADLYGKISYLSQDAPVFDGTIRENLVFDRQVPDAQLYEALHQVQLSEMLAAAEEGLDTQIGERGTLLSGGEKQRLALARLWFEDSKIVILDEATSAMDNLTEESVMKAVTDKLKGRTVIAIAHRLSSIMGFDKIVVFRDGTIVAQGTFEELLRTNAYFAELYQASMQSIF